MKNLLLLLSFGFFLFSSCDFKKKWPEEERNGFMEQCKANFPNKRKAKAYCPCALEKVESKYPKPEDFLKNMNLSELEKISTDCLK